MVDYLLLHMALLNVIKVQFEQKNLFRTVMIVITLVILFT